MKLTKTSAQAVLALAFLYEVQSEGVTQARQVAEHLEIPTESALKILQVLARQKLIESQLGRSGGYRLTQSAEQISLLQVVEAVDGPIHGQVPLHKIHPDINRGVDLLRIICEHTAKRIRDELRNVTIADIHAGATQGVLAAAS